MCGTHLLVIHFCTILYKATTWNDNQINGLTKENLNRLALESLTFVFLCQLGGFDVGHDYSIWATKGKKQWLTLYYVYKARFNPSWNDVAVSVTITLFYLHQQNAVTIIQDLFNNLTKGFYQQVVNEKVHYR